MGHEIAREIPAQVNEQVQQGLERQRMPHVQPGQEGIQDGILVVHQLRECRTKRLDLFIELEPVMGRIELSPRHQMLLEERIRTRTGRLLPGDERFVRFDVDLRRLEDA